MSNRTIWKYTLPLQDVVTLTMPVGAEVLSVGLQDGNITLWAMVHSTAPRMDRVFYVYGTGNPINGGEGRFIGTVQMNYFVWHIFEAAR
jgi:hypothetical protein